MNIPATVLIVESDPDVVSRLNLGLLSAGFYVQTTNSGQRSKELVWNGAVDLVLLSADLPEQSGIDLCRQFRTLSTMPIILMTSPPHRACYVQCLDAGADDCIPNSIDCRELQARINAIFRRISFANTSHTRKIQIGQLCLDPSAYRVFKHNRELTLRQKEYELLYVLMSRPGQVVSRTELLDQVWGVNWMGDTRTLDVHIRWVREKIEDSPSRPHYIQTVRGVGYRFIAPAEISPLHQRVAANGVSRQNGLPAQIAATPAESILVP